MTRLTTWTRTENARTRRAAERRAEKRRETAATEARKATRDAGRWVVVTR